VGDGGSIRFVTLGKLLVTRLFELVLVLLTLRSVRPSATEYLWEVVTDKRVVPVPVSYSLRFKFVIDLWFKFLGLDSHHFIKIGGLVGVAVVYECP
jgi:hypothetical protein